MLIIIMKSPWTVLRKVKDRSIPMLIVLPFTV